MKAGDVVWLRSGGPAMTVISVDDQTNQVRCWWFEKTSPPTLCEMNLPSAALNVAEAPDWSLTQEEEQDGMGGILARSLATQQRMARLKIAERTAQSDALDTGS